MLPRFAKLLLVSLLSPMTGLRADSVVVFNELQFNPIGTAEDGEWLELHNQMAVDTDLSGWQIDGGIEFTFPKETVIPGGGYLLVAKDPAHPSLPGGVTILGPYSGFLSNGGERIDLLSSAGRRMDRIEYDDEDEWPVAADGSGVSLAKRSPSLSSDKSAHWGPSAQVGGTPGARNFTPPDSTIRHDLVAEDAVWAFEDSGSHPASDWNTTAFDDAGWSTGQALFGNGTGVPVLTVTQDLVERFRAADIPGAVDGQALSTWPDLATGDGATQSANAGGDPTFHTNVTPSGEPVVRFDGNDEFRTSLAPGIGGNDGFVYIAVVRGNTTPSGGGVGSGAGPYIWDRVAVAGAPLASLKPVGDRYGFQRRHDNNSDLGGPVSTSAVSTTDFQIVAIRRNTTAARFELWVDGIMESTSPDNGTPLTPDPINIGRHATNESGGFNGDIAELLIYRDELSSGDFDAVGSYLEARYGLDTAYSGAVVTTPISNTAGTTYFRQSFTFNGDPTRTSMWLETQAADGAAYYLNGTEIHRDNLPTGSISHSTTALSDRANGGSPAIIPVPSTALVNGNNVLAVSLHTAAGDNTASFAATLSGSETPPDPTSAAALVLNEVAGAGDAAFFVEIINRGTSPLDTNGFVLAIEGNVPASIPLPATTLPAGSFLQLNESQLGQRPADGDKLFLFGPGGNTVTDAREVTNRLRGRSTAYPGQWIFPDAPTPGATNSFRLETDIVINEICYHAPILPAVPAIPPTATTVELINANATWRFNESGDDLGASWAQSAHPVGGNWESGPAIIAYDPGFPDPIATPVDDPRSNSPYVRTYYFETELSLSPQQAADLDLLELTHLIDDGAVFYLNGTEIHRFHMPDGPVTASSFSASPGINLATYITENVAIPAGVAVAGSNRLSVEVHQISTNSGDMVFGLEANALFITDPGTPGIPRRESDEQWIELHNRGTSTIDLSDWDFGEGINFNFPHGTTIAGGAYLLVAKDPASLQTAHPGIEVIGPYSGSLSRSGETLTLRDAANNPADVVRYTDGGRWPGAADGQGSTLELRDPVADNALPGAWAASNELARTSWQTYSYRGTAAASAVGPDDQWHDFILGLLEEGELLLDDITVIEDPDGSAVTLITDGSFEGGNLNSWRPRGNHRHATIIPDPDGGGNVLHLRATGSTEHMHNNLETTLAGGNSVIDGREYEISFRARWLSGCNLLHSRLYFNRLPMTTELARPAVLGTPGAANSTLTANLGPTAADLAHSPVVPAANAPVTVRANLTDPDGIGPVTLHYAVNGGSFQQVAMSATGNGDEFAGTISGQAAGLPVQFYIEASDALGATSFLPAAGPDSRAMFEVEDGRAAATGIHNIRIIMDPADVTWMHTDINVMSNDRIPCTVIYRESEIYYDCGVRIKGSQRARTKASRVGFNLAFPKDQLFRGVHRTIAIDRSEGQVVGQRELLFDLMATSSRGVPGEFNDLCYVLSPDPVHTSAAVLQMARFGSVFLDSQFENGADGTVFEYELIYYPTTADAQGYKIPQPDKVLRVGVTSLGSNVENYRWNYLIKNNQEIDDYSGMLAMTSLFDQSAAVLDQQADQVLDTDQWLRAIAYSCATGAGDSFYVNSRHNGQFYAGPDGRVRYFPHDLDFAFSATLGIFENTELNKLIANPARRRQYLGHLHDICTTVYNQAWMASWTSHYDDLVPGGSVFNDDLAYINSRSNHILGEIDADVIPVAFAITTNGGADFSTSTSPITLAGDGWVNIRALRLAGSTSPLPVNWTDTDSWEIAVPLAPGTNPLTVEAYDFTGSLIASDSITVTSTADTNLPATDSLVVSEIYYNPPGGDESTEYIELLNISPTKTLDLTGTAFVDGITFTFTAGTSLAPGERLLLVANASSFESRFGTGLPVAGTFSGSLDNGGETIALALADGTPVQTFDYEDKDPWPEAADGDGFSLVLLDPAFAPDHNLAVNWTASGTPGGSPGTAGTIDYATWKSGFGNPADNTDDDGDGWTTIEEYYLGGDPTQPDHLAPGFTFDHKLGTVTATITRRADVEGGLPFLQQSSDLGTWLPATGTLLRSNERLPGSSPPVDRLTFTAPLTTPSGFFRFAF